MTTLVTPELTMRGTWVGFWRLLPLSLFVVAFGLAFGLAAVQTGLSASETVLMSMTVFAGTAQFAALDLWEGQVPVFTLLVTTFAINARHLLMGASLYPWLRKLPIGKRYASILVLSDANWAMTLNELQIGHSRNMGLLLGGGIALWCAWMTGTLLGMAGGSAIAEPEVFGLDMVMGCFMLSMALGGKKNARMITAWVVGGAAALAAYLWLPANTHVVVGALAGGLVGVFWLEEKR
jgi:predicted branched-subunit amino acid permease